MIGFLRFVGLINAAVWLGTAVSFVLGAKPAISSRSMVELIGTNNFPFFSIAIGQLMTKQFLCLYLICAGIAVAHMAAEWLYLGKYPSRFWLGMLAGLCLLGLVQGGVVQPILREAHTQQFDKRISSEQRASAARSFKVWRGVSEGMNYVVLIGLGFYFWRVGNPPDPMRFVSARQFRS